MPFIHPRCASAIPEVFKQPSGAAAQHGVLCSLLLRGISSSRPHSLRQVRLRCAPAARAETSPRRFAYYLEELSARPAPRTGLRSLLAALYSIAPQGWGKVGKAIPFQHNASLGAWFR